MAIGDPTGADLVSGTTDGNTLPSFPTAPSEREITFGAGVELTGGVKYTIVAKAPDAGNNNDAKWQILNFGTYPDGDFRGSNDGGVNWGAGGTSDIWFKTYAGVNLKESHVFADTGVQTFFGIAKWKAQSFTPSSTYTITSIKVQLRKATGENPGTITFSIKATEGAPTKAINPTPSDANSDVTLDQATITWEDGGGADTYNVYYGDTSGDLTLVSEGQAGLSLTVTGITNGSPYDYEVTRYWRIDSINAVGTTTGDEWSFTTIVFDQLKVSYMLILGGNGKGPYGTPPGTTPVGTEGTDWRYTGDNNMTHIERLVVAANNKIWFEST